MSARVVEQSGAQVLPPSDDRHRTVSAYHAASCADADLRVKSPRFAELAASLRIDLLDEEGAA